jgi:MbtH protein
MIANILLLRVGRPLCKGEGRMSSEEDTRRYKVVINDEEQYSIWFEGQAAPLGWRDAGKTGAKKECLDYIGEVWKDMRPLSLRRAAEVAPQDDGGPPK